LQLERKQPFAAGGEGPFDVLGHHPRQQLGRPTGLLGQRLKHVAPVIVVEHIEPELHLVGIGVGALHPGMHPAPFKPNRGDVSGTGVFPGAFEPFFEVVAIDELHPLLDPPGLLAQALVAQLGGDGVGEAVHGKGEPTRSM
jgi:hypothetical protein